MKACGLGLGLIKGSGLRANTKDQENVFFVFVFCCLIKTIDSVGPVAHHYPGAVQVSVYEAILKQSPIPRIRFSKEGPRVLTLDV